MLVKSNHRDRLPTLLRKLKIDKHEIRPLGRKGASEKKFFRIASSEPKLLVICKKETVEQTVKISSVTNRLNLRTPEILEAYPADGALIIEDVGDIHLRDIQPNEDLYSQAFLKCVKILAAAEKLSEDESLPELTPEKIIADLALFRTEFADEFFKNDAAASLFWDDLRSLALETRVCSHLALGDVSPDNVMIQGPIEDESSYVFIDIQDAFIAPFGFDIISLIQDVRSEGAPISNHHLNLVLIALGRSQAEIKEMYILGLFRLLRIIGTFVRLDKDNSEADYMRFLPHIQREISTSIFNADIENLNIVTKLENLEKVARNGQ